MPGDREEDEEEAEDEMTARSVRASELPYRQTANRVSYLFSPADMR